MFSLVSGELTAPLSEDKCHHCYLFKCVERPLCALDNVFICFLSFRLWFDQRGMWFAEDYTVRSNNLISKLV